MSTLPRVNRDHSANTIPRYHCIHILLSIRYRTLHQSKQKSFAGLAPAIPNEKKLLRVRSQQTLLADMANPLSMPLQGSRLLGHESLTM